MSNLNGNHSNNKNNNNSNSPSSSSTTTATTSNAALPRLLPSTISLNSFQTINKNNFYSQQQQQQHNHVTALAPLLAHNASISHNNNANTNNYTEIEYSGIFCLLF